MGFSFVCDHKPIPDGSTRYYRPASVSISTSAFSPGDKVFTVPFSGSRYVVGSSLESLNKEVDALQTRNEELSKQINALSKYISDVEKISSKVRIWESDWIKVEKGKFEDLKHGLGTFPDTVTVWYASSTNPTQIHKMDPIVAEAGGKSAGYGSFITHVDDQNYRLAAGLHSATSSYGYYNSHWRQFEERFEGKKYPYNTQDRFIKVVFSAKLDE